MAPKKAAPAKKTPRKRARREASVTSVAPPGENEGSYNVAVITSDSESDNPGSCTSMSTNVAVSKWLTRNQLRFREDSNEDDEESRVCLESEHMARGSVVTELCKLTVSYSGKSDQGLEMVVTRPERC